MTKKDYLEMIKLFGRAHATLQELDKIRMEIVSQMSIDDAPFGRQDMRDYLTMVSADWAITSSIESVEAMIDTLDDNMPKEGEP